MSVWSYEGKRVVIAGCATGMGEATARELLRLGAEVHAVDVKEPQFKLASYRHCDLRDPASIDKALDGIGGHIDRLFTCSGLPQTFPAEDVVKVNFTGMRYWTQQAAKRMSKGGAIALISSTAGFGFPQRLPLILEFVQTPDFNSAVKWFAERKDTLGDPYGFSKEASTVWTLLMGSHFIKQGIRINCICPGPTTTPMMKDFEVVAGGAEGINFFTQPINRRSTPAEQAYPLIFLNSDAASYINGHNLNVDGGFVGSVITGQIDMQAMIEKMTQDKK